MFAPIRIAVPAENVGLYRRPEFRREHRVLGEALTDRGWIEMTIQDPDGHELERLKAKLRNLRVAA